MKFLGKMALVILGMCIGSILYQRYGADEADYMETFQMLYWVLVTSFVYWNAGLLANKSNGDN